MTLAPSWFRATRNGHSPSVLSDVYTGELVFIHLYKEQHHSPAVYC